MMKTNIVTIAWEEAEEIARSLRGLGREVNAGIDRWKKRDPKFKTWWESGNGHADDMAIEIIIKHKRRK